MNYAKAYINNISKGRKGIHQIVLIYERANGKKVSYTRHMKPGQIEALKKDGVRVPSY